MNLTRSVLSALIVLFAATAFSAEPIRISGPLVAGGDVTSFQITPDSTRVVFLAIKDTPGVPELYGAPMTGAGAAIKLSGSLAAGGAVGNYKLSADSKRAVFLADKDTDGTLELYSADDRGTGGQVVWNDDRRRQRGQLFPHQS